MSVQKTYFPSAADHKRKLPVASILVHPKTLLMLGYVLVCDYLAIIAVGCVVTSERDLRKAPPPKIPFSAPGLRCTRYDENADILSQHTSVFCPTLTHV